MVPKKAGVRSAHAAVHTGMECAPRFCATSRPNRPARPQVSNLPPDQRGV